MYWSVASRTMHVIYGNMWLYMATRLCKPQFSLNPCGRTGSQERIDEFSQNSALGAFEENGGQGVRRSAFFLPEPRFPYRLEEGNLEVGGGGGWVILQYCW